MERAVALKPGPLELRRAVELYRELGEHSRAADLLDDLVRLSPGEARMWVDRAESQIRSGRPGEAERK